MFSLIEGTLSNGEEKNWSFPDTQVIYAFAVLQGFEAHYENDHSVRKINFNLNTTISSDSHEVTS